MIMENGNLAYYMRSFQKNYLIYIIFCSVYINKIIQNVEQIHISSEYEVIETDTTLEEAQNLVDEIIENAIEKYISKNEETPIEPDETVTNDVSMWQYIKSYKPFTFIFRM